MYRVDLSDRVFMLCVLCLLTRKLSQFDSRQLKIAYVGDVRNNVTYDLMRASSILGFEIRIAGQCPGLGLVNHLWLIVAVMLPLASQMQ